MNKIICMTIIFGLLSINKLSAADNNEAAARAQRTAERRRLKRAAEILDRLSFLGNNVANADQIYHELVHAQPNEAHQPARHPGALPIARKLFE